MTEQITSRDNPNIRLFRRLSASRKDRRETGLFAAEGLRLCREAMAAEVGLETLLYTGEAESKWGGEIARLRASAKETLCIAEPLAEYISDTRTPQGVFCICRIPRERSVSFVPAGRYLLLDGLQDPGNLGTIVRSAEAFGVTALVLAGCPDLFSPKVLRSTMGSAFRLPVYRTADLPGLVRQMSAAGLRTYAAALDPDAAIPQELPREKGMAVVIGNEGNGVSQAVMEACGAKVYIPMAPSIESLNAAAAAAVLMWEMCGRSREKGVV